MAELLEDIPVRALAVYAHPDDPEISCGATLARWAAAGCEVHVVVAAQGEKGSLDPATDPVALAARRADEARAAAAALGVAGVELLGHPDGDLDRVPELRGELVGLIRRLQPEVVVCPDPTAAFFGDGYVNHVDHRALGWATLDAVAPAAAFPLYHPGEGAAHQVGVVLLSGSLEPDVWVDVSGSIDAKVAALFCHESQLEDGADSWLADFVRQRAAEEGARVDAGLAEGFRRLRFIRE
ncbi:MAG TPA: PIG-L deacetylase family protein [Acidimicrobiales bacterium]|nr:PIG-L deacetylase family protein [Acidimicrobiales bacterium]